VVFVRFVVKVFVTIQLSLKAENKSLLLGVSGGNVGGRDAEASLQGCIHGIFRKLYPVAVTISNVLNSYNSFKKSILYWCIENYYSDSTDEKNR
jgi:hypothetical protein